MRANLFYLSPNPYGGWVTYTSHLMDALKEVGITPYLYKVRPKSEKFQRDFGYGKKYQNISLDDVFNKYNGNFSSNSMRSEIKLVVAGAKQFKEQTQQLYDNGAFIVVHDPTELKNLPENLDPNRCISIRQIGARTLKGSTFIRHPYSPFTSQTPNNISTRGGIAISTSRIDFDKHTEVLLDANRLLPDNKKINIRGFENRIYTRFKIVPKYPEWVQSKAHYPRENDHAFNLMKKYIFNVDMTQIVGDGGGTQYTWLEAWNAGCIPIIHSKWLLDEPDDMKPDINCLVVSTAEELAELINSIDSPNDSIPRKSMGVASNAGVMGTQYSSTSTPLSFYRENGSKALALHSPKVIGKQYLSFFEGRI
tara:strand:+ start:4904 stop:5998 length:1095 start_codon:yes stop_codon:yes gene_type:complete